MSIDCFSRDGKKYELVAEDDGDGGRGLSHQGNGGEMRGVRREVIVRG